MKIRLHMNPYSFAGFALSAVFAVWEKWSLPEFCWSTWLAGLIFAWACVLAATLHVILGARQARVAYAKRFPVLLHLSPLLFILVMTAIALLAGLLAFRIVTFALAFYGLFLSVFAGMEPQSMFGPNGFINSDFFTPVAYLLDRFWPVALGMLVANWEIFVRRRPWKQIMLPLGREIIRLHLLVLALPFISMIAWVILGDRFQAATIFLLMGVLYFLPAKPPAEAAGNATSSPGKAPAPETESAPGENS